MAEKKKSGSPRFKFNTEDLFNVLKNAVMVGLAAILTFIVENIGNIEMGESLLIVIPMVTMGLNAVINWINDNTFGREDETEVEEESKE